MKIAYICSNLEIIEMDDDWIIMDTEHYTITKVNEVGAFILTRIKERKSLDEIEHLITSHYDADPLTVKSDVLSFIEQLENIGLLIHESN
ncbi:PqqD family protein [Ammoniphilus sp. YIM 78166]|uniref:PqqD family protein n=1 Tax=Ammoniphilus sp. YIM 78166 TaxID=1644106 RepID=UPI00106F7A88|nr:PqqD family protein [Ammoniphilus sp. YIM 78166]